MIRWLFAALLGWPLHSLANGCDLTAMLATHKQLVATGKSYAALALLEARQLECQHPRLLLEQGTLHLQHGNTQAAIELWQQALADESLPAAVAKKIKLQIIRAQLNPPSPYSSQATLSLNQQWNQQLITGARVSALLLAQHPTADFAGYALTPAFYLKASGQAQYLWRSDITSHAGLVAVGGRLSIRPFSVESGLRLRNLNEDSESYIDSALSVRLGTATLHQRFSLSLSGAAHEWQQQLNTKLIAMRVKLESEAEYGDSAFNWTDYRLAIDRPGAWQPGGQLNYQPLVDEWHLSLSSRWQLRSNGWFTLAAGARYQDEARWHTQVGFLWRTD